MGIAVFILEEIDGYQTTMKKIIVLFFGLALNFAAYAQEKSADQWGVITNNLQMSIRLKNGGNEITNGQPCILEIRYRNVSTNETVCALRMKWTEADWTYSFIVTDPSGKDISPDLNKPFGGSATEITISPGQTQGLEYKFSGVCKMDEVGTYKIIAKKFLFSGGKNGGFKVCSNPLLVTVAPNEK